MIGEESELLSSKPLFVPSSPADKYCIFFCARSCRFTGVLLFLIGIDFYPLRNPDSPHIVAAGSEGRAGRIFPYAQM
jgi:hypothetical protein